MLLRATGGTEQSTYELSSRLPNYSKLVSVSNVTINKPILHMHQSYDQPSAQALRYTQNNYKKIVFVSEWQSRMFQKYLNINPNKCIVIGNGVNPLPIYDKPTNCINLCYSSTPFRGLDILIDAFNDIKIDNVYLHVFSGMGIYGRDDKDYLDLYAKMRTIPNIRYYGAVPNIYLCNWMARNGHIWSYSNTWEETYCMALHEAMSANMIAVCPNIGALNETCPDAIIYDYNSNKIEHTKIFKDTLIEVIKNYDNYTRILNKQKKYADSLNWDNISNKWNKLLNDII
jgi:glycosyltransferase involved in cell wall biosynthesis